MLHWGLKLLTNLTHVWHFACVSPERSAGALGRPQRSEGDQHTPASSTNASPTPLSCQHTANKTRRTLHAFSVASGVLIARMEALSCDDKASDDELRPNLTSLSQWALHASLQFPCPQYVRGEERCVWRRTRVTVVGQSCRRPVGTKRSRLAVNYSRTDFMDFLIAMNAGGTGRSWTSGRILLFSFLFVQN